MAQFPYGWTSADIDRGVALARSFGGEPRDVFALWYFEAGLQPHIVSAVGYYGLIQSTPQFQPQYVSIVQNGSIAQQLDEIARVWTSSAHANLGESYASRASKLGVTTSALIYAMNACPAVASQMRSANQPMFIRDAPGNPGVCYAGNPIFDHQHKGYITLRDFEDHLATYRAKGEKTSPVSAIFAALPTLGAATAAASKWGPLAAVGIILGAGGLAWYLRKHRRAA